MTLIFKCQRCRKEFTLPEIDWITEYERFGKKTKEKTLTLCKKCLAEYKVERLFYEEIPRRNKKLRY